MAMAMAMWCQGKVRVRVSKVNVVYELVLAELADSDKRSSSLFVQRLRSL